MQIMARRRGARRSSVQWGEPRASEFVAACGTVLAELCYLDGEVLLGYDQQELSPLLEECLTRKKQIELQKATRIMEDLSQFPRSCFPRMEAAQVFAPVRERESWDLYRLERIFMDAQLALRDSVEAALRAIKTEDETEEATAERILVRSIPCDEASRFSLLSSALLVLAAECTSLRHMVANANQRVICDA